MPNFEEDLKKFAEMQDASKLEAENQDIKSTVQRTKPALDDLFELEVRAQGVDHGVVASPDQIAIGRDFLHHHHFPALAHMDNTAKKVALSAKVWELSNDCHDANGKFCETTGGGEGGGGEGGAPAPEKKTKFFKQLFGSFSEGLKKGQAKKTALPEPVSAYNQKNDKGFSQSELDMEKDKIRVLAAAKTSKTGVTFEHIDANTRANAVAEGRLATKKELSAARETARWNAVGGLFVAGWALKKIL